MESQTSRRLKEMYDLLFDHFGAQHWWPADTDIEMMVGAVLTQNTNWKNVKRAIENLKGRGLLSLEALRSLPLSELAIEIRPAGYFNVKAARLRNLVDFLVERCGEDPSLLRGEDLQGLRKGLLSVKGVGPETADSIILYGAGLPVFVIDAYTHRILSRHGMADEAVSYDELQALFMDHLPEDTQLFNEFHALIVKTGKEYCRRRPLCSSCPLKDWGLREVEVPRGVPES